MFCILPPPIASSPCLGTSLFLSLTITTWKVSAVLGVEIHLWATLAALPKHSLTPTPTHLIRPVPTLLILLTPLIILLILLNRPTPQRKTSLVKTGPKMALAPMGRIADTNTPPAATLGGIPLPPMITLEVIMVAGSKLTSRTG